jgi:hypothetical protein
MNIILFALSPILYAIVCALLWTAWHCNWRECRLFPITPEDEITPWWLGYCWVMLPERGARCAPIGANLIARIVRALYCFLREPLRFFDATFEARALRREVKVMKRDYVQMMCSRYSDGCTDGHAAGYVAGLGQGIDADVFRSTTTHGVSTGAYGVQVTIHQRTMRAWDSSPEVRRSLHYQVTRSIDDAVRRLKDAE